MLNAKWILLILVLSQVFLYAARIPMQRAIRSLGEAVSGAFAQAAKWWKDLAREMTKRSRELVLESGRESAEAKIAREFHRIEGTFARDLAEFPTLSRKLDDLIAKADADYRECGVTPPPTPQWMDLVNTVNNMPKIGSDGVARKFVDEIQKAVVEAEKKAHAEFREVTNRRHKILSGMSTQWAEIRKVLQLAAQSASVAVASTSRIDGYMQRYEQILDQDKNTNRVLGWVTMRIFLISGLVMAVALGGAFINFQLIALPMSELVPAGSRLMGLPVPSIAALVLVLMEIAAGIFVLEMLGVTSLFPQLDSLSSRKRRGILAVAFCGLFLLASIESSLAVLREQIVEAESALKQSLAGAAEETAVRPIASNITVIGQAVLGFVLPWILAMIAIPLEMLINTAGPIFLMLFSVLAVLAGQTCRLVSDAFHHVTAIVNNLYDAYIIIPLRIEGALHRDRDLFDADRTERSDASFSTAEPMSERRTMRIGAKDRSTSDTREHEVVS